MGGSHYEMLPCHLHEVTEEKLEKPQQQGLKARLLYSHDICIFSNVSRQVGCMNLSHAFPLHTVHIPMCVNTLSNYLILLIKACRWPVRDVMTTEMLRVGTNFMFVWKHVYPTASVIVSQVFTHS
jgi:hypothetical protein